MLPERSFFVKFWRFVQLTRENKMLRQAGNYEYEQREQMRGGEGSVTIQHYFKKEELGGNNCRLCARLILPPGSSIGLHPHEQEDEVYIICKGTGSVTEDGKTFPVNPGDSVLTGKGKSHSISNSGSDKLEIIALIVSY
jgi:mannose-6-phosphate isomerase-like protein (cupin superfamily)